MPSAGMQMRNNIGNGPVIIRFDVGQIFYWTFVLCPHSVSFSVGLNAQRDCSNNRLPTIDTFTRQNVSLYSKKFIRWNFV
jgi:hypothetical protein